MKKRLQKFGILNFPVQNQENGILGAAREIGKGLTLLDASSIHDIDSLARPFHEAAAGQDFGETSVAGIVLPEEIILADSRRETSGADDFQPPRVLSDDDRSVMSVVPMGQRVENRLPHGVLVERRNVPNEKSLLKVLEVVAQIYSTPDLVEDGQETASKFAAFGGGSGGFGGAVLEEHLGLRQVPAHGFSASQKDQGGVGEASGHQEFGGCQDLLRRRVRKGCRSVFPQPQAAERLHGIRVQVVERGVPTKLRGKVERRFLMNSPELFVGHRDESVSGTHPVRASRSCQADPGARDGMRTIRIRAPRYWSSSRCTRWPRRSYRPASVRSGSGKARVPVTLGGRPS
jgi:hypothetical protein